MFDSKYFRDTVNEIPVLFYRVQVLKHKDRNIHTFSATCAVNFIQNSKFLQSTYHFHANLFQAEATVRKFWYPILRIATEMSKSFKNGKQSLKINSILIERATGLIADHSRGKTNKSDSANNQMVAGNPKAQLPRGGTPRYSRLAVKHVSREHIVGP